MLKNKRILLVASAVVFLVVLFLVKNTSIFKNEEKYEAVAQIPGLSYDANIGDLVEKDADQDGIADWEEPLYGLDPTKKETTPGVPDGTTINKLKNNESTNGGVPTLENLTETDKFSRELLSTATSLSQNGLLDQVSADQIGSSLADRIKNSAPRKIFSISDIKIDPAQTEKNYDDALTNIFEKSKMPDYTAGDVLKKFIVDENTVDPSALIKLDLIIKGTDEIINALIKTNVPPSLASLHVDFLNGWERVMENLSDIKLYEADPIVALSAISQYQDNSIFLINAVNNLATATGVE